MRRKILFIMLALIQASLFIACGGSSGGGGGYSAGELEADEVRIWYYRFDQTYTDHGLYVWGSACGEIQPWNNGVIAMEIRDGEGKWAGKKVAVYDVKITDATKTFNLIFRGPNKVSPASDSATQSPDISGIAGTGGTEVFFLQQDGTVYAEQPYPMARPVSAEWTSTTAVKLTFNVDEDIAYDKANFAFAESNDTAAAYTGFTQTDKVITFTSSTALDFLKRYKVTYTSAQFPEADPIVCYLGYSTAMLSNPALVYTDAEEATGGALGATLMGDGSVQLRLWSPTATAVKVHFYDKNNQATEVGNTAGTALTYGANGVWSLDIAAGTVKGGETSLDGYFYQYEITANGATHRALDPYAKSMAAFSPPLDSADEINGTGKAAIVDLSAPAAGTKDVQASFGYSLGGGNNNNMVVYEVHVRDFTIDDSYFTGYTAGAKGKFKGFAEKMTENYKSTAGSYLKDLGITHVQLLPVWNHYRVSETGNLALQDGSQASPNYNWGYDPHSYFTPEGAYATNPANPYVRIAELRALIKACHDQGIGVITDVVYNHTYHNWMLDRVAPGCYYRKAGGSTPVGEPAVATENPMTRKLIVDSMKMMKDEYGVDGVRYDLMGFIDTNTVKAVRTALGNEFIMHGEAWNFTDLPTNKAPIKGFPETYPQGIDLAMFNDSSRDSYAGNMSGTGFVHGVTATVNTVRASIIGGLTAAAYPTNVGISDDNYVRSANEPNEMLQYLSAHDGYTLWDKINLSFKGSVAEQMKLVRQATSLLFLSQGKIFIQGGDEIARTKPVPGKTAAATTDPTPDRCHTTANYDEDPDLVGYTHRHENSYQSSDFVNKYRWDRLLNAGNPMQTQVAALYDYHKKLIAMRKAIPAFRMDSAAKIKTNLMLVGSESASSGGDFASMSEIDALTVKFVNGPANLTIYFAGEVHPEGIAENPSANPFKVTLNASGAGSYTFTAAQVNAFQLSRWGAALGLNIKMVQTAGSWAVDALDAAYSGMGNNNLSPTQMTKIGTTNDAEITVDLSIMDHAPGSAAGDNYVAFLYKNYTDVAAPTAAWTRLVLVGNPTDAPIEIPLKTEHWTFLGANSGWKCILDGTNINYASGFALPTGLTIATAKITVPAKTIAVIAKP